MNKKTVLVVDDEFGARESLRVILESEYNIILAEHYTKAMPLILKKQCDLILLDICMPDKSGLELLGDIRKKGVDIPVIMVTATKTIKTAVFAMKNGARDYITKPFDVEEILATVKETLSYEKNIPISHSNENYSRSDIIGHNTSLKKVFKLIDKLSTTDSTVLIFGESGTGKELIARDIHFSAKKNAHNFVPVHLSALSENLIESELFGHVKGSFTGADRDREGAFCLSANGTIFLDEIGEISESVQIKLLRVIQEKEYKAVGDSKNKNTNARIVAATNKDLYALVQEGKFRADLYYRLNVVPVNLPPLRERKEDIYDLTFYLLKKICSRINMDVPQINDDVLRIILNHDWPGNIRELENTLENMVLLSENNVITIADLPRSLCENALKDDVNYSEEEKENSDNMLSTLERETIQMALLRNNCILTTTAKYLGTTRRILKYKMDKLGIDKTTLYQN